jgi:uncharacterized protein (TIGR02246 family)
MTITRAVRPFAVAFVLLAMFAAAAKAAEPQAKKAPPKSNVGSIKSDLEHENSVRDLYAKFNEAWNRHDTQSMAGMWALDGDHQEPDGHTAKGRAAVLDLFTKQHQTVFKDTKLDMTLDAVWFITANTALVDGSYEVSGIRTPDGNTLPPRKGHLTSILLHEDGRWWIVASRLMIPTELPYKKP